MLSKRLLAGARAGSFHKTSVPAGAGAWRVAPSGAFFGLCFRTESHRNELQSTPARRSEKRSTGVEGELTKGLCAGGPPARLQPVDKSCHQQSRWI